MSEQKKLLIVDDDPNVHAILKMTFEKEGFRVFCALDAMQGPMVARQSQPDIILLDIMMPAGGGIAVYNRLKQFNNTFSIPVIIYSSTLKHQIRANFPQIDEIPFLQKPADLTVLIQTIKDNLRTA